MNKTLYVLGVAQSANQDLTVVVRKDSRMPHLKNLLNGPGGKVQEGENPLYAMTREFLEETGVETSVLQWNKMGFVEGDDWIIIVYVLRNDVVLLCKTITEEPVIFLNDWRKSIGEMDPIFIALLAASQSGFFVNLSATGYYPLSQFVAN